MNCERSSTSQQKGRTNKEKERLLLHNEVDGTTS